MSWIQSPSNANPSASRKKVELCGTFNFKLLDEFHEGKAFIEYTQKKEIEDRIIEIEININRDLQIHRNLLQAISSNSDLLHQSIERYDPTLLLDSTSSSTPRLLEYSSIEEERTTTNIEEKVRSGFSRNNSKIFQEEIMTTEREEKVSLTTHHSERNQQLQQGRRTEFTALSHILMLSTGMNDEKIVEEGKRKIEKEKRDLEKEHKSDRNGAYIKASDRFREIDKSLQLGYKKDLTPQTVSSDCFILTSLTLWARSLRVMIKLG